MAEEQEQKISRRRFIKNTGYVAGGAIGGGILGSLLGTNMLGTEQETAPETADNRNNYNRALMYFKRREDFNTLSAATERIFPEDDNGPGAVALGVPYFIDHQLASGYGHNDREYMQGPFYPGTDYQGYQTRLQRHELFMVGIRALNDESRKRFDGSFVDLEGEQQDEILTEFENNGVAIKGATSSTFFEELKSATLAGAYADPLYGGNADMEGWRMKEFPGSQMSYTEQIDSEEFVEIEPDALTSHTNF
ncbi:gluconate 2-dehydrogenase subunit 3 family protein [Virgibacillus sediminis]|uniref:Gluconate 2-dehydrogenase subunit 3 family protein n=1 Tax=Virgibacillus sediminis TaxID=202260 RepID=A0ABV7A4L9_9BACI